MSSIPDVAHAVEALLRDLPFKSASDLKAILESWHGKTGKFIVDAWIEQARSARDKRSIEVFLRRIQDALRPDLSWTDSDSD
jgi:hypothetical protein